MTKTLTPALKKALIIIRDRKPERATEFAFLMWNDSEKWNNSTKSGKNGGTKGGGMALAGGGYLGRMKKDGWINIRIGKFGNQYSLTEKAEKALEQENSNEE